MATAYIGFGGNIGDKVGACDEALRRLDATPGVRVAAVSDLFRSDPMGILDQDWFVNGVARLETDLAPRELLDCLIDIEARMGRVRREKNGPRRIDLDILLYGEEQLVEPNLTVPHPGLLARHFVLVPLLQLLPYGCHPASGERFATALARLPGDGGIVLLERHTLGVG
ncbi:MAG: 2-amino-4-hydroxy-6-hydroxymethyldihydropteridine diphosphokinase [Nitrospirota bacterium]|jgi:2-amino-4-hydroxy-6-hydroxymethyldihydropteridine diphosphokinase